MLFGSRAQMVTEAMSYVWFTDPTQVGPTTAEGYTLPDGTVVEPDKILQFLQMLKSRLERKLKRELWKPGS